MLETIDLLFAIVKGVLLGVWRVSIIIYISG